MRWFNCSIQPSTTSFSRVAHISSCPAALFFHDMIMFLNTYSSYSVREILFKLETLLEALLERCPIILRNHFHVCVGSFVFISSSLQTHSAFLIITVIFRYVTFGRTYRWYSLFLSSILYSHIIKRLLHFFVFLSGTSDDICIISGANTNGAQIYITTVWTPWLDDKHVIFGKKNEWRMLNHFTTFNSSSCGWRFEHA